jgi:hypothetical protein
MLSGERPVPLGIAGTVLLVAASGQCSTADTGVRLSAHTRLDCYIALLVYCVRNCMRATASLWPAWLLFQ